MSEGAQPEPRPRPGLSATLAYTTARLGLFAAACGVLWMVRVRGLLLIVLALAISGLASFVLLRGQRLAMGGEISRRISTIRARSAERTAREDAAVDAILAEMPPDDDGSGYPASNGESGSRPADAQGRT